MIPAIPPSLFEAHVDAQAMRLEIIKRQVEGCNDPAVLRAGLLDAVELLDKKDRIVSWALKELATRPVEASLYTLDGGDVEGLLSMPG